VLDRRTFIAGSAALALPSPAIAAAQSFVVVIVDDLLSVTYNRVRYGPRIRTPNLDRLVAQGVFFSNAFCSTALCNPSRTAILTGLNPFKTGIHRNRTAWHQRVTVAETFPGMMAANGWQLAMFGKVVHSYAEPFRTVSADVIESNNNNPEDDAAMVDGALDYLSRAAAPFLLMVGLRGPHAPHGEHPEFNSLYPFAKIDRLDWNGEPSQSTVEDLPERIARFISQDTSDRKIQRYLSDVTAMDAQLGRLLAAVHPDTTVFLTSDHGHSLGDHDIDGKFTLWDEAGRAPLIIRQMGVTPAMISPVVSLLDIAPTMLDFCGIPQPAALDGVSLAPLLSDPNTPWTRGAMTSMGESLSFRHNRWRVSEYADGVVELYDQDTDPESLNNLADDPGYGIQLNTMLAALAARRRAWGAS